MKGQLQEVCEDHKCKCEGTSCVRLRKCILDTLHNFEMHSFSSLLQVSQQKSGVALNDDMNVRYLPALKVTSISVEKLCKNILIMHFMNSIHEATLL
jgi:hypothetical protein